MIARLWRGVTPESQSEAYMSLLERTGVKDCRATPGNRGVFVLRRAAAGGAEFLFVSLWDSLEAIRRFAGPDIDKAVYYPEDSEYLLELEPRVAHYEVAVAPAGLSTAANRAGSRSPGRPPRGTRRGRTRD